MAIHIMIHLPDEEDGSSCTDIFLSRSASKDEHFYTFGCPVYALIPEAESDNAQKWYVSSKVDLYLGSSPMHIVLISLVLSLETGLAPPRFSIVHACFFETA